MCGGPVDAHDRQIRFRLPEPVLDSPGQERVALRVSPELTREAKRVPGAWLSHESPEASVMMQIPGAGPFVRALLVVRLTGGYAVTYGVWAGVHPGDLQRAFRVWWDPGVRESAAGRRACQLGPSVGTAGSPGHPGSEGSGTHALLCGQLRPHALPVLGEKWPHKDVLETLP